LFAELRGYVLCEMQEVGTSMTRGDVYSAIALAVILAELLYLL
jgi:hypothetical protein